MPTQVQFRRGDTSQNNSFTGGSGEVSVNTDNSTLRVHNGSTAGGFEVARADLSNISGVATVTTNSVSIGATQVISSSRQLKNITSLDATTTATIESAVSAAPNDFTSLNISGIGTVVTSFNVGTGGTIVSATSSGKVGLNSTSPTTTLDIGGNQAVSGSITVGSATTISATGLKVGTLVEVSSTAVKFAGVEIVNATGIYMPTGVITAASFNGTLTGSVNTSGIATATTFSGNLSGTAVTTQTLTVSGISSFAQGTAFVGVATFYNNIDLQDNDKIILGEGNDLEIYHSGTESIIDDVGGGPLKIRTNELQVVSTGDENLATFTQDGAVSLYHNNIGIVTTRAGGLDINGGAASSGIVTALNGFSSGIGTAVKITTVANQLIFTVVGVGSTSFTLY